MNENVQPMRRPNERLRYYDGKPQTRRPKPKTLRSHRDMSVRPAKRTGR